MTTPSLCKSYFKTYFLYKLRTQLVTFIISAMFNIISLPLYAGQIYSYYSGYDVEGQSDFTIGVLFLSVIILLVMAITGGARAFTVCTKKDHVDLLGSLPLTRKEHFFADFLSGYIVNVGAFIPCAVVTMIIAVCTNKPFMEFVNASELHNGFIVEYFALVVLAVFLLYTFAYLFSALITVCSGKASMSIVYTIVVSVLMLIIGAGIGDYVVQCVTGLHIDASTYMYFIPPLGLAALAYDYYGVIAGIDLSQDVRLSLPWGVIAAYIIVGAGMIYAAYYIFKNRKAERTGRSIADNALYKALCIMCVVAASSVSAASLFTFHAIWIPFLISLVISIVIVFVFEAIRGFKKVGAIITGTRCAVTLVVCFAVLIIANKTGMFGWRYFNASPNNVESITTINKNNDYYYSWSRSDTHNYTENLTFDDQADIEQFIKDYNQTLKSCNKDLRSGNSFQVIFTLKNGKHVMRSFNQNYSSFYRTTHPDHAHDAIAILFGNVHSLPNYASKASEKYSEDLAKSYDFSIRTLGIFGEVEIPSEMKNELCELFTREIKEKYSASDNTAGELIFKQTVYGYAESQKIDIPSSCTETLAYANALRPDNSDITALTINYYGNGSSIDYPITVKSINGELGQELMSLLSTDTNGNYIRAKFSIYSTNMISYYVPVNNEERVRDVVLKLIEQQYLDDLAA